MKKHKQGILVDEKENVEMAHQLIEGLRAGQTMLGDHYFILFQVNKNKVSLDSISRFHPVSLPNGHYLPVVEDDD